jgi:hypothetical protein
MVRHGRRRVSGNHEWGVRRPCTISHGSHGSYCSKWEVKKYKAEMGTPPIETERPNGKEHVELTARPAASDSGVFRPAITRVIGWSLSRI